MDGCLSSTLKRGSSIMMSYSVHQNFNVVSCRATIQCGQKRAINFHEVLSSSGSVSEIKKAYRKMALQYHPDVCHSSVKEESTKMFVELQEVYRSLMDGALENDCSFGVGLEERQCPERHPRSKWESQLIELSKQSQMRRLRKDGSWGCRMRARFIHP
ncbi:chaperone protein dnaJ 20, chloroplastic-like [Coffea eugenioides]|uniref:chaperone protein dnaJ 20, chloroplastic-like n=1 Tax=Coffea eugenioides TaxID=49369 RepID=UPI000F614DC6|nr:chaperone protein dnaJ 20, chloroplastic-like [Coffea eugenioides]